MLRYVLIVGSAMMLCACSTLPKFDTLVGPTGGPKVDDIVQHIGCELYEAVTGLPDQPHYVAYADLTLEVTNNQGISPTLSFITPYSTANTNFTGLANGQLTGQQHRQYEQSFVIELDPKRYSGQKTCGEADLAGLRGNLGLKEVFLEGSRHQAGSFPFPDATTDPKNAGNFVPVFGTTVDFTVVYGLSGGPNWTLTDFTGPSGSTGIVTLSRTLKDTLVLSVARMAPPKPPGPGLQAPFVDEDALRAQAAAAARDNAIRMILQRLLTR